MTAVADVAAGRENFGRARRYSNDSRPQEATRAPLDGAKQVLVEYQDYLPLTVRQIFYRLVTAEQVERCRLPTAPTKPSSHARGWGERSTAQLKAFPPDLQNAVSALLEEDILASDIEQEEQERVDLTSLIPGPGGAT